MIKVFIDEYKEGKCVIRTKTITFLCIPIFKRRDTTTNIEVVKSFTAPQPIKIKGFYETKNKNKEN